MAVATQVRKWTLQELHRLPDDGNKYELVRGELFVTPPPGDEHETILAKLTEILVPYVRMHGLGHVYHPRAVFRLEGSEVEPDLMVRQAHPSRRGNDSDWDRAPVPILVVEVLSSYTRRRDHNQKKSFYLDAGIAEYWIVDPVEREITVAKPGHPTTLERNQMTWLPPGAESPLELGVAAIFEPG
jgi:Uma2 family endonuclease